MVGFRNLHLLAPVKISRWINELFYKSHFPHALLDQPDGRAEDCPRQTWWGLGTWKWAGPLSTGCRPLISGLDLGKYVRSIDRKRAFRAREMQTWHNSSQHYPTAIHSFQHVLNRRGRVSINNLFIIIISHLCPSRRLLAAKEQPSHLTTLSIVALVT